MLDNYIQEVDIASGEVLFEWSAFDAVPPDESHQPVPDGTAPWDAYHLNSVIEDRDGDLLVSARHAWAVYKIDRETGDVVWRLGGKQSDFTLGRGALFAWPHDADRRPDGTLSLFDNQAASPELVESDRSRGLILRLDEAAGTAELAREFTHPAGLLAPSQGNLQNLPGGHVLVGWGSQPHFSEYDELGRMVFDARFFETAQSYRAFLFDWTGTPVEPPVVVATAEQDGARVSVSWNGATEVRAWRVLGAASEGAEPVELATAPGRPRDQHPGRAARPLVRGRSTRRRRRGHRDVRPGEGDDRLAIAFLLPLPLAVAITARATGDGRGHSPALAPHNPTAASRRSGSLPPAVVVCPNTDGNGVTVVNRFVGKALVMMNPGLAPRLTRARAWPA